MKRATLKVVLLLCAAFSLAALESAFAIGFSLSSSAVTNDFFGNIGLSITSLPSAGQTVRVEKFYDLNNNGAIDVADPLMQCFFVTDGVVSTIDGVKNLNVPGDTDGSSNGQMTVALNYPSLDQTFSRIEGTYIFRISSPSSSFSAVTQSLQVKQPALTQYISGLVYEGTIASTLTNAFAIAFDSSFNPVGGAKANANGRFRIYVPPGAYTIWAFLNGYAADQSGGYGMVGTNISFTNASVQMFATTSATISGKLMDKNVSTGLPGVAIFGYRDASESGVTNSLIGLTFTDTQGNYSLPALPGNWQLDYLAEQMPSLGYVAAASGIKTNISGNVSGLNISVEKATALIHGTIMNDQIPSAGLSNVTFAASDTRGKYKAFAQSYASDGRYTLGVVPANWWIEPTSDSIVPLGYLGTGTNWVVSEGEAAPMNFMAKKITAHIRGRVLDEYLTPASSASVHATDSSGIWVATATADPTGSYDLGVFGGTWTVTLDSQTAATWDAVGPVNTATVADGGTILGFGYRFRYATGYISGSVTDTNGAPLEGVGVSGIGTISNTNYLFDAVTDNSGSYFSSILAGSWTVKADCFGGEGLTLQNCECVPSQLRSLAAANNIVPTFVASPLAPPTVAASTVNSSFIFSVTGPTNRTYQIQGATNLLNWKTIFSTNTANGSFQFATTNSPAVGPQIFRTFVQ